MFLNFPQGTYTDHDVEEPHSLAESDDGTASVDTSANNSELMKSFQKIEVPTMPNPVSPS